ncbi:hypothetical protein EPA93_28310 [Ktedonosporobacter rubrisoli]|uniref:Uncharacterized protein n=1 Tax=Ktedonosporobacter rubrisoli TaxID=2509675 RepID=A0A4V0YZG8_KTERU|nr:hypothetical protein [Ktedonosporobacter rubrisoli]QBD79671.1 hypothetical protein EPA93_28310 [Ktedonosporobacter rubrisoli]
MPFEQLTLGEWVIEVDSQATHEAYLKKETITCSCPGCQNYLAACLAGQALTSAMGALFEDLGMLPEKETEVYVYCGNAERHQACYGGFSHLVGRLLNRPANPREYTSVDDWFQVAFTEKAHALSPTFPQPVLQMEFLGVIPWVLPNLEVALSREEIGSAPLETLFPGLHWRPR